MEIEGYYVLGVLLALVVVGIVKPFVDRSYRVFRLKLIAKHGSQTVTTLERIVKVLSEHASEYVVKNEEEIIKSALKNTKLDKKVSVEDVQKLKSGYQKGKKFTR